MVVPSILGNFDNRLLLLSSPYNVHPISEIDVDVTIFFYHVITLLEVKARIARLFDQYF